MIVLKHLKGCSISKSLYLFTFVLIGLGSAPQMFIVLNAMRTSYNLTCEIFFCMLYNTIYGKGYLWMLALWFLNLSSSHVSKSLWKPNFSALYFLRLLVLDDKGCVMTAPILSYSLLFFWRKTPTWRNWRQYLSCIR